MNELGRSSLAKGTHRGPAGAHPAVAGTTVANQLMATCNRLLTSSGHGGDTSRGAHRAEGAGFATCTLSSPRPIAQRENVTLSDGHGQRHDPAATTHSHNIEETPSAYISNLGDIGGKPALEAWHSRGVGRKNSVRVSPSTGGPSVLTVRDIFKIAPASHGK